MTTYKYSDARRNDPELSAKVRKVAVAQQEALVEAAALLEKAAVVLSAQSGFVGDEAYERQTHAVRMASRSLGKAAEFMVKGKFADSSTYIGNLAAGPLGEQLEHMGDDFPL